MSTPLLQFEKQNIRMSNNSYDFPEITVNRGDLIGFIGLAGSGKAILIRILASLIKIPNPPIFTGENTGFIFQNNGVLNHHSLYDNVVMPVWFDKDQRSNERIQEVLEQWNLKDLQNNFINSWSPQVVKITQYARCNLLTPDIIFIERPHLGLLLEQRKLVNAWIEQYINNGVAVINGSEPS